MSISLFSDTDLMPPPFSEGLCDWSREDGTPETLTYETARNARLARNDADFGDCLEVRKLDPVQRLRYMGEVPVQRGAFIEFGARVKAMRGPLPEVRAASFAGGIHASVISGLPLQGPVTRLENFETVYLVRAVIGPKAMPGVDLVWDSRAVYAHLGIDILGPENSVLRIEQMVVREVTLRFLPGRMPLPGFEPEGFTHQCK